MSSGLQEGTIFAGRYKILRCIAKGGMGAVYEVVHIETERRRALKVMHPHILGSQEMHDRFKLEAKVAAHIESEFIVDVFDAGIDEATQMPFLVMEMLRGEELGKRLKRVGRFSPTEVVTYLNQVAMALDKTHQASIVHRDLKPDNLFLTERDDKTPRIKILDFGIAKVVADGATAAGATRSLGTPLYMSPEQFRTGTKLSPAADIYALGMIAYTLLVGEPYWSKEARGSGDVIAFAMAAIQGPQEQATIRAAARGVTLPPGFDAWFARATAANPAGRFQTASEAVRELEGALQGTGAMMGATMPLMPAVAAPMAYPGQVTPPGLGGVTPAGLGGSGAPGLMAAAASNPVTDPAGVPAGLSHSQGASPQRKGGPAVAVALATILIAGIGLTLYLIRDRQPPPDTVVSSVAAARPTPSASATQPVIEPVAAASERMVHLAIAPADAVVEVDERAVSVENGSVELRGALGSVHHVRIRKDGRTIEGKIVIAETGPVPAQLKLDAEPNTTRPSAGASSARAQATPPPISTPGTTITAPPSTAAATASTKTPPKTESVSPGMD